MKMCSFPNVRGQFFSKFYEFPWFSDRKCMQKRIDTTDPPIPPSHASEEKKFDSNFKPMEVWRSHKTSDSAPVAFSKMVEFLLKTPGKTMTGNTSPTTILPASCQEALNAKNIPGECQPKTAYQQRLWMPPQLHYRFSSYKAWANMWYSSYSSRFGYKVNLTQVTKVPFWISTKEKLWSFWT